LIFLDTFREAPRKAHCPNKNYIFLCEPGMGQQEPQEQQISEPPVLVQRPTMVRYQVLTAACTVAVVAYIHRVGFSRALPAIQNDLSLSNFQSGVLAAVFSLAYGAFEIPFGLLGDPLGVRH